MSKILQHKNCWWAKYSFLVTRREFQYILQHIKKIADVEKINFWFLGENFYLLSKMSKILLYNSCWWEKCSSLITWGGIQNILQQAKISIYIIIVAEERNIPLFCWQRISLYTPKSKYFLNIITDERNIHPCLLIENFNL